ncbi:NAD(P)H azoreductase [Gammaproteobacteria bacterium]|nr:NAD(P)H-binding protein [Gammaproteobacteria bacterium]CAG0941504.1 NAD(P)H azoreductase [Gammaproteobacteria bacterium]
MNRHRGLFGALLLPLVLALLPMLAGVPATATAAAEAPRDVMVFGGTGQLGAEIVRRLVARGDHVTVFTRPGSDRRRLDGQAVRFVEGDLMNPGEIDAAFRGRRVDAVITAVRVEDGDMHFYGKLMPPLTAAAKAAGVRQFIHSSAVGAGANIGKFASAGWERVPGLLDRLQDQGVGEDVLRQSGLPFTIIRNTRLWPDGTPPTGKAELTEDDGWIGPMTRADLAALTVSCLGQAACLGKTYHVRDTSLAWPPPR